MSYIDLDQQEERELVPGYHVKFLHTANMTCAYWRVDEGAAIPNHSHHHEQVVNVIEGRFQFDLDGDVRDLEPGAVVFVPPNVKHKGKALTPCRLIDIFHPAREDYM